MKKMMIALVAMFVMTMSANAQSNDNNGKISFDRLSRYLELKVNQVEPVKTALAQFSSSMEAYYQLQDTSKGGEAWEKIRHLTLHVPGFGSHSKKIRLFATFHLFNTSIR